MPWFTFAAMFFVVWFIVLFVTLPFGVRRIEHPDPGSEVGAPEHPYMWRKAAASAAISAVITFALWYGLRTGYIDFRG